MKKTQIISVTSGKGGVGKTTMVSNLALALSLKGQKVLIFDGDLGMANVDLFFGIKAKSHFIDVLSGEKTVSETVIPLQKNIDLISGGHGITEMQSLDSFQRRNIVDSLTSISLGYNWIIIDTSPGISDNVLYLNSAADEIHVIVTPDPSSFADSYALIKLLHLKYKRNKFTVLLNQVKHQQEGLSLFVKFESVVNRFLNVGLDFVGSVPMDLALRQANQNSRLILRQDPKAPSAVAMDQISTEILNKIQPRSFSRATSVFWEQVMGVA